MAPGEASLARRCDGGGGSHPGARQQHHDRVAVEKTGLDFLHFAFPLAEQDLRIVSMVIESGRALVIAYNKWDLVDEDRRLGLDREIDRQVREELAKLSDELQAEVVAGGGTAQAGVVAELAQAADRAPARSSRAGPPPDRCPFPKSRGSTPWSRPNGRTKSRAPRLPSWRLDVIW